MWAVRGLANGAGLIVELPGIDGQRARFQLSTGVDDLIGAQGQLIASRYRSVTIVERVPDRKGDVVLCSDGAAKVQKATRNVDDE